MRRLLVALLLMVACATPAAAEEPYVDLGLIVEFDKDAYLATDVVRMRVLVMNSGTATATGVVVRSKGDLEFKTGAWGDFEESGPGAKLGPGQQVQLTVTAPPIAPGEDMTQEVEVVSAEPDIDLGSNRRAVEALVTVEATDLTVTIYGDTDRDGVVDQGETMAGVVVTLIGGIAHESFQARTAADGTIRFPKLPGGRYWVKANVPNGWYIDETVPVIVRSGQQATAIAATHDDLSKLVATVSLDRASYAVGDTVRERVTLTNTGASDLTGLFAKCGMLSPFGNENHLFATHWDELTQSEQGPGATVRAGETRVWEFTDVVAPRAYDYGFVVLECNFTLRTLATGAYAGTRAAVPGGKGTYSGQLVSDGQPVPDVKLLLIDTITGEIAARAVSDATGRFLFPELRADLYELRALGPWRWETPTFLVQVFAGEHREFPPLVLLPGPVLLDPAATPPAEKKKSAVDTPAPQASPTPRPAGLADTGTDVAGLTALGTLLMVTGALCLRRRQNCV
jgi:hypothetical protein